MEDAPRGLSRWPRIALVLVVLAGTVGCDRATKVVAEGSLRGAGRISMLGDLFRLELTRNTGAFLSLGATLAEPLRRALLEVGVAAMVLGLIGVALLGRRRQWLPVSAFALLAGGGLGNLWDRVANGAVTDFMNLGIGSLRTGIFNVADLAIVAGIGVLLVMRERPVVAPVPVGPPLP